MLSATEKLETYFGLPQDVQFCTRCVFSNQKPLSSNEFQHTAGSKKQTLDFDERGVCLACRQMDKVNHEIDWKQREEELLKLLDQHRSKDGSYDCLVPGSGGKDSVKQSHILKHKYGMHPLTVTWAPHLYTDVGFRNFQNWIHHGGCDNYLFTPNGHTHRLLTKLAVENLFHPFQPFIVGQKTFAPKMAKRFGLKLVFYGEMPAQYGEASPVTSKRFGDDKSPGYQMAWGAEQSLGGVPVSKLKSDYGLSLQDLEPYLPAEDVSGIEFQYLGYYLKWVPQDAYYYACENIGFQANDERTEGTYSKYNSLDDKIDGFHYWTTFVKFGIGRATYDAAQEIRNGHITRDEGVALVRRFDGEFPKKYFQEVLEYLSMTESEFFALADRFRSPHLWAKENGEWKLRHQVGS